MSSDKKIVDINAPFSKQDRDEAYLFQYPGIMFVKGREFLDRRIIYRDQPRQLSVVVSGEAKGITHKAHKKFVRAVTVFQIMVVYAVPDGAAVYTLMLADPKVPRNNTGLIVDNGLCRGLYQPLW